MPNIHRWVDEPADHAGHIWKHFSIAAEHGLMKSAILIRDPYMPDISQGEDSLASPPGSSCCQEF